MRLKTWITGGLLILTTGCSSMNNTEKGALGGAAVGTGLGALIGRGNPAAMAIGAVGGTMVGAVAGAGQDRREERRNYAVAAANAQTARQMHLTEVIQLAQRGTPEDLIIRQIESTGSNFSLTTNDIIDLRQQGVSDRVVSVMQARRYPRTVVVQPAPVYVGPPPVVYEPVPVVGVGVGVRGGF